MFSQSSVRRARQRTSDNNATAGIIVDPVGPALSIVNFTASHDSV